MRSSVTSVFKGAPSSFQLGNSSVSALRVHHRTRQNVGADFAAFFQHDHGHFLALLGRQLFQA